MAEEEALKLSIKRRSCFLHNLTLKQRREKRKKTILNLFSSRLLLKTDAEKFVAKSCGNRNQSALRPFQNMKVEDFLRNEAAKLFFNEKSVSFEAATVRSEKRRHLCAFFIELHFIRKWNIQPWFLFKTWRLPQTVLHFFLSYSDLKVQRMINLTFDLEVRIHLKRKDFVKRCDVLNHVIVPFTAPRTQLLFHR